MKDNCVFQRYELKYLLTAEQYTAVGAVVTEKTSVDKYGKSTVYSLYFDTPDYLLIRRSIEKPTYKEKLRLRSYGNVSDDGKVFLELKKKYKDVVYKRRVEMTYGDAKKYLSGEEMPPDCQIAKEIDYAIKHYERVMPAALLTYDRLAYYGGGVRITFDSNIKFRTYDLSLNEGAYGTDILPEGCVLMEIKAASAIPLWLAHLLSENKVYKTSFSKYGTAYTKFIADTEKRYKYVG